MAAVCTCVAAPSELCSARVYIELAGWLAEGARREAVRGDCWASFYCAALSTDSVVCRSLSIVWTYSSAHLPAICVTGSIIGKLFLVYLPTV
jgi:hypothetical protein